MNNIRTLTAGEIDCRVQSVNEKGCSLLLYKDARVDMAILDEVFGNENWQRTHEVINGNLFCNIEIWSEDKKCWVKKQDVGTESITEKEKGQASDSFKRAGFNIGIGRELYTAPFVWISLNNSELTERNGKKAIKPSVRFRVSEIGYNNKREISELTIVDQAGTKRFELGKQIKQTQNIQKEEMSDDLILAISEMNRAKTVEEVKVVWNAWKHFQADEAFKKATASKNNLTA